MSDWLVAVLLVLLHVHLFVIYRVVVRYLRSAAETLHMVKVWSELAHTQHKDAQRVMRKVEDRSDASAVAEVVADKVVEKIQAVGDSAVLKGRPPGGPSS